MVYKEHNGKIYLVPNHKTENPDEWPEAILPLSDISVEDLEGLVYKIQDEIVKIYDTKQENKVTKQVVLQRLQRTLIVFLNSLWSKK